MEYITFKQFIYTVNIRDCYEADNGKLIEENDMLRIFYSKDGEYKKDNYIDIGWYDFFNKDAVWSLLSQNLNKNILESKVTDFRYNKEIDCLEVHIQSNVYEDLQSYQN